MHDVNTADHSFRELRPPSSLLVAAGCSVLAAYVLLLFGAFGTHLAGYLLGSFVSTGLVLVFMKVDLARRVAADGVYLDRPGARFLWSAVLLAGLVACALHAWRIATELAVR